MPTCTSAWSRSTASASRSRHGSWRRDALVFWQRKGECAFDGVLVWARDTAAATARMLDARLRGLAREPLTDPKALDLFLRARHEYGKRWPGTFPRAIELLEQARKTSPADPLVIARSRWRTRWR